MYTLYYLFCIFSIANGLEYEMLETFVIDVIETWQLLSPTIVFQDEMPTMCMKHQWILCLTIDMGIFETAEHLDRIFKTRKQDGIIFVGDEGHGQLVRQLVKVTPFIFSSNCPVFMPADYTNDIRMRLDSNMIFYKEESLGTYKLLDKFAVKGGPIIVLELGYWNVDEGVFLQASMNRWDRRTDLKGATLRNCLLDNSYWANFKRDESGNITGSKGYFQDMLFYITEKLNLTIETVGGKFERPKLLENGSWTGLMGSIQRKEVDVLSMGMGINLQRSYVVDFPISTDRQAITLIAAIPKGAAPNMWVYVRVFGIYQWMIFLILLTCLGVALSLLNVFSKDEMERELRTERGVSKFNQLKTLASSFALVYLYAIQMGDHTSSRQTALRLLTITASMLTFLMFVYYTGDITSEMTSGPAEIPIRTFEDVIHHKYKVIAISDYDRRVLQAAKPGTAKNIVQGRTKPR